MKRIILIIFSLLYLNSADAQTGKDFWFAPPDITDLHNPPGGVPFYLLVSSAGQAAQVTISQPANAAFNGGVPIVVNLNANESKRINLSAFQIQLETRPTNTILNTGLHIVSTADITTYYEVSNTNNTDIFALKGSNSLGTEFYIPLYKYAPFYNHTFANPHQAIASFDIVATQNNTVVTIYSPTPVDGHPALQQFSITLNAGQTYSCGWTGANYEQPSTHPGGAVVLSDKPVAITIKDDSNHNPSGGCYDLTGDQIIPVNVLGTEYIAVKGQLNNTGDESVFITATQNNTKVYINGSSTPSATLFAGESYRYDMDYLAASVDKSVYVSTSKPAYAVHVTGFGCEMGMALLPQLGCAGSRNVSFVRSSSESFFLTVLVRSTALSGFSITGPGTATINTALFTDVPGTGGVWKAGVLQFNTTQIPVDSTFRISNSIDVFAMGIINGGASTGCRYGYFSEYSSSVNVNAGADFQVCANTVVQLAGTVGGGASTGIWKTNGSGNFLSAATNLNAIYQPSPADTSVGVIRFILTSTGSCTPTSDTVYVDFTPAPEVNAGNDINHCSRDTVQLSGTVSGGAVTGLWSTSGSGVFHPNAATLNAKYIPSAADEISGSVILKLVSTSNGNCIAVSDSLILNITPRITVNAGSDASRCSNSPNLQLNGSVTGGSSTGSWSSSGTGIFLPDANTLNAMYAPGSADTAAGTVYLVLSSASNGYCAVTRDTLILTLTDAPVIFAGSDQNICINNPQVSLSGIAWNTSSVIWTTSGTGTFTPSATNLNTVYTASASDISSGSITLKLSSAGPAGCNIVRDSLLINFYAAPVVNAGSDTSVCADKTSFQLSGIVSGPTVTGTWSTSGSGMFLPDANTSNAVYIRSSADSSAGYANLVFTSSGNGNCNAVKDTMKITYSPTGSVNAGADFSYCANANPQLNGSYSGSVTSAVWTTTGSGSFLPSASTLNAAYIQSASDTANGSVTLILTGNSCNQAIDSVTITFTDAPVVNAGSDATSCGRDSVQLNGLVTAGASTGLWNSTGTGVFYPNAATLNSKYIPSAADVIAGSVKIILSSTSAGTCITVRDTLNLLFSPSVNVNAGSDVIRCANNPSVNLAGTVSGGSVTGQWSTSGSGIFNPSVNALNAVYLPSSNDTASGTVTLYLTSTQNGYCAAVKDSMIITLNDAPVIDAGTDQSLCANNAQVSLSGSASNTTGVLWSSSGTGSFSPSSNVLNAVYLPSASDINSGNVVIRLQSTGPASCNIVRDSVRISFTPSPVISAGTDTTLCVNNLSYQLSGFVTGPTVTGSWTSNGNGTFTPSANIPNAIYNCSAQDVLAGSVRLIFTSTNNGNCNAVTDTMLIHITPAGSVNAGSDITYCGNANAQLNGLISGSVTSAVWSSTGSGTFSPSPNALNAKYIQSSADTLAGQVSLILTGNSCESPVDTLRLTFTDAPVTNAGVDQSVCGRDSIRLAGSVTSGSVSGTWTSSGTGTFYPSATTLNAVYLPSVSDVQSNSVKLILSSTGNGTCAVVRDTLSVSITPSISVNAGNDKSVCANNSTVQLSGNVNGGSTTGLWTTSGNGLFSPSASALNSTYIASANDTASGAVWIYLTSQNNGFCNAVKDSLRIIYNDAPEIEAGPDMVVCENNPSVHLQAQTANTVQVTWSTSGNGSFSPSASSINAVYNPSVSDLNAGSVILKLTSVLPSDCNPVSDSLAVNFTAAPEINAGRDTVLCISNRTLQLNGSVTGNGFTSQWSSTGTGTFSPDPYVLNAVYYASAADSALGNVKIILTSANNGNCIAVTDTLQITFLPPGLVNAGSDFSICANADIQLNANISGAATGGVWSTMGSGTFGTASALSTSYIQSTSDTTNGYVNLIFTGNSCDASRDTITISFTPAPVVNAGSDLSVCANNSTVLLDGAVQTATGAAWSGGNGIFTQSNVLNTTYIPSASEIDSGSILLTITSTGNGTCKAVSDQVQITVTPAPEVYAGTDTSLCRNTAMLALNGSVSGGSNSGIWTSTGSGAFTPSQTVLSSFYNFSPADTSTGSVMLILTSSNNGNCLAVSDTFNISLTGSAIANAGSDQKVCASNLSTSLNGNISGISLTGIWTTTGTGTFSPSANALNAIYTLSSSDSLSGSVALVLHSDNNGLCPAASDTVIISVQYEHHVNAGQDIIKCANLNPVMLTGTIQQASGGKWTTSGTGSFSPSDTSLLAYYIPSVTDTSLGLIYLVLTSKNEGACTVKSDTVQLIQQPLLQAGFSFSNGCVGNLTPFEDASSIPAGNLNYWFWNFGDGTTSLQQNPDHTYDNPGTYQVTLQVTSDNGCAATKMQTINVYPSPAAGFTFNAASFLPAEQVNFVNTASGYTTTTWNFGDSAALSYSENPVHLYQYPGTYPVTQIVTNQFGCSDSVRNDVIIDKPDTKIYAPVLPTAFSPNGDNNNDILYVRGGPFRTLLFRVYDEWGNELFKSVSADKGWDGTGSGYGLPSGVYIWTVSAVTMDDKKHNIHGEVKLIR